MPGAEEITTVLICMCPLQRDGSFFGITLLLTLMSLVSMDEASSEAARNLINVVYCTLSHRSLKNVSFCRSSDILKPEPSSNNCVIFSFAD